MADESELPRELRTLLSADGEGPALRMGSAAAERLVQDALLAHAGSTRVRRKAFRPAWLLAAALVFTGSAAALYVAERMALEAHRQEPAGPERQRQPTPRRETPALAHAAAVAPEPEPSLPAAGRPPREPEDLLQQA